LLADEVFHFLVHGQLLEFSPVSGVIALIGSEIRAADRTQRQPGIVFM
jgi:hypothetical protein